MEPRINEKIECSHCNYLFAIFDRACFCFENMADVNFCPKCGAAFQSNSIAVESSISQNILNLLDQMEESNSKACKEFSGAETITFDDQHRFNGLAVTNNAIREIRKRIKELF